MVGLGGEGEGWGPLQGHHLSQRCKNPTTQWECCLSVLETPQAGLGSNLRPGDVHVHVHFATNMTSGATCTRVRARVFRRPCVIH